MIDPVELLGSMAPPTGWNERVEVTGPDRDERAASIYERVISDNVTLLRSPRRRLRIVTSIVVVASLGSAAAAALWAARQPDEVRTVACWSDPAEEPLQQVALRWNGVGDPIAMCASEWVDGILGEDGPPGELRACVNEAGVAAVMPGDESVCATQGFDSFEPVDPNSDPNQRIGGADLETLLVERYNLGRCYSPAELEVAVRSDLDELGYEDWIVGEVLTIGEDGPCGSISVEAASRTVFIVRN